MRKVTCILLALLCALAPLAADDITITPDVPVTEKGFSFDPAAPYLPPVSGFAEHMEAGGAVYSVYVPEDHAPWSPGVIILVPDGTTSVDFALGETGRAWMQAADDYGFALGFVESAEGGWNTTGDSTGRDDVKAVEDVYTQMRSKSMTLELPFTMDKSRVFLVGYEEGGAMALAVAAGSASTFAAVAAIDQEGVDASYISALGETYCFPFPSDGMRCKDEVALVNNTLAIPVWFINSYDEGAYEYYRGINSADRWSRNDWASVCSNTTNSVETVWRTEGTDVGPAVIWTQFLSLFTRPMGEAGGHLDYAMDFSQRENGRGYVFTEEEVGGLIRRYITYVPESYDPETPAPLVMVCHGYTATMYALAEESRWADVAEENGIIVVFPQGYPVPGFFGGGNIPAPCWEYTSAIGEYEMADDASFLAHVIDQTKANYNIDDSRIFGTGHSNGCMMMLSLASARPELFTAIAPIGAALPGLVEALPDGGNMPLSLYYGQYDSAVDAEGLVSCKEYWTRINGLEGVQPVSRQDEDGLFTTESYLTEDGIPLVEFTEVTDSAHSYFPAESWRIWNEFFSHWSEVDGVLYYDGMPL